MKANIKINLIDLPERAFFFSSLFKVTNAIPLSLLMDKSTEPPPRFFSVSLALSITFAFDENLLSLIRLFEYLEYLLQIILVQNSEKKNHLLFIIIIH